LDQDQRGNAAVGQEEGKEKTKIRFSPVPSGHPPALTDDIAGMPCRHPRAKKMGIKRELSYGEPRQR
jgi:hypothetical protein